MDLFQENQNEQTELAKKSSCKSSVLLPITDYSSTSLNLKNKEIKQEEKGKQYKPKFTHIYIHKCKEHTDNSYDLIESWTEQEQYVNPPCEYIPIATIRDGINFHIKAMLDKTQLTVSDMREIFKKVMNKKIDDEFTRDEISMAYNTPEKQFLTYQFLHSVAYGVACEIIREMEKEDKIIQKLSKKFST